MFGLRPRFTEGLPSDFTLSVAASPTVQSVPPALAGGSTDLGFTNVDFGLNSKEPTNPKSQIRN
jgi:hypothetical protein